MVPTVQIKPVTMADVARAAGVTKAAVSYALSGSRDPKAVSVETRARITRIAHDIGYQPNHAARSLATRRSQCVGFVLSDDLSEEIRAWLCSFTIPTMEQVCRRRNYHLLVSTENLTSAENFALPENVGQRRVDGVIFSHIDESNIVEKFVEFGLPCVCLGDDPYINKLMPTFDADLIGGWFQGIRYAAALGHRSVGFIAPGEHRKSIELIQELDAMAQREPTTQGCRVTPITHPDAAYWRDVDRHVPFIDAWLNHLDAASGDRPTLVMGPEQVLPAFLCGLYRHGLQCPRDVSLIANGNAGQLDNCVPPLTAVNIDIPRAIDLAVNLLIDHIESGQSLTPAQSRNDIRCTLDIRESCASPTKQHLAV